MKKRIIISILLVFFLAFFACGRMVKTTASSSAGDTKSNPLKVSTWDEIVSALTNDKKQFIKLTKDIKKTYEYSSDSEFKSIEVKANKYLDLNGYSFECHDNSNYDDCTYYENCDKTMIIVSNDATLYIEDSGNGGMIYFNGVMAGTSYGLSYFNCDWYWNKCARDVIKVDNAHLIVTGGTIKAGRNKEQTISSKISAQSVYQQIWGTAVKVVNNGSFVSLGGTYYGNGQTGKADNKASYPNANHNWAAGERDAVIECGANARVSIFNGTFYGKGGADIFHIDNAGFLTVTNGTFKTEKLNKIRETDLIYNTSAGKEHNADHTLYSDYHQALGDGTKYCPKHRFTEGTKGSVGIPESAVTASGTFGSNYSFCEFYIDGQKATKSQLYEATGTVVVREATADAYITNADKSEKLPNSIQYVFGTHYEVNMGYPNIYDDFGEFNYGYKLEIYRSATDSGTVVAQDTKGFTEAIDLKNIYENWSPNKTYRLTLYGREELDGCDNVINYVSNSIIIYGINPLTITSSSLSEEQTNKYQLDEKINFDFVIDENPAVDMYWFDFDVAVSYQKVDETEEHVFYSDNISKNDSHEIKFDYALPDVGTYLVKLSFEGSVMGYVATGEKTYYVDITEGQKHSIKVTYVKEADLSTLSATTNVISRRDNQVVTSAVAYRPLALSIKCADGTGLSKFELKYNGTTETIPANGNFQMPDANCEIVIYLISEGERITYVNNDKEATGVVKSTPCDNLGNVVISEDKFTKKGYVQTKWTDGTKDYDFGDIENITVSMKLYPVFESVPYEITYKGDDFELIDPYDGVKAVIAGGDECRQFNYNYLMENGFGSYTDSLVGWSTVENGSIVEYELGQVYDEMVSVVLYPVYKKSIWIGSMDLYAVGTEKLDIKATNMLEPYKSATGDTYYDIEIRDALDGDLLDNMDLSSAGTAYEFYVTIKVKNGEINSFCNNASIKFDDYNTASFAKIKFEFISELYAPKSITYKLSIETGCKNGEHDYELVYAHRCVGEIYDKNVCKTCGAIEYIPTDLSVWHHDIEFVETVSASCWQEGVDEHYECTLCGRCFSDAAGTTEINRETLLHEASHTFNPDNKVYYSDENSHWLICNVCILHSVRTADETSIEAHIDLNNDEICDVCNRNLHVHTYGPWEYEYPTCTSTGAMTRYCTKCGGDETIYLPKSEHKVTLVEEIIGTCETGDIKEHYYCTECGAWLELDDGEYLERPEEYFYTIHKHTYADGFGYDDSHHYSYCIECGHQEVDDTDGVHVTDAEYEYYYDENVHYNHCREYDEGCLAHVNEEPHEFDEIIVDVAPTCGKAGVGHRVCKTCGYTEEDIEIPATGNHTLSEAYEHDDTNHYHVCSTCGQPVGEAEHQYENGACKVCGVEQPKEPTNPKQQKDKVKRLPTGAVVGIVCGSVVVAGGLGFGAYYLIAKKQVFKKKAPNQEAAESPKEEASSEEKNE